MRRNITAILRPTLRDRIAVQLNQAQFAINFDIDSAIK